MLLERIQTFRCTTKALANITLAQLTTKANSHESLVRMAASRSLACLIESIVNFRSRISYLGYDIYTRCAHHLVNIVGKWEGVSQDGICQQIVTLASEWALFSSVRGGIMSESSKNIVRGRWYCDQQCGQSFPTLPKRSSNVTTPRLHQSTDSK